MEDINSCVNFLNKRNGSISFTIIHKMKSVIFATLLASANAIQLTKDTWEEKTAGKAVFVKFFAPWCGHCKRMKPAWDSLMSDFADSESVLVADVDCIEDGKALCEKVGVKGFPTIKYGDPDDLQDYTGSRDHPELHAFTEGLQPGCVVETLENCSDEHKKILEELKQKKIEDLRIIVLAEAKEREQTHTDFKAEVDKLQKAFEELTKKKETTLEDVKSRYNVGFVKQLIKLSENKSDL